MTLQQVKKFPLATLVLIGITPDLEGINGVVLSLRRGRPIDRCSLDALQRHVRDRLFMYGAWKL